MISERLQYLLRLSKKSKCYHLRKFPYCNINYLRLRKNLILGFSTVSLSAIECARRAHCFFHISRMCNCARDEGRPFGAGLQEQASNHLKLLWAQVEASRNKKRCIKRRSPVLRFLLMPGENLLVSHPSDNIRIFQFA